MTIELPEKEHHVYGGSSAKIWSNCYGWAGLMATRPPEPAGEAADTGTALHIGILERKTKYEIEYLRSGNRPQITYDDIPNWPDNGAEIADAFWESVFKDALEGFITKKVIYIEKKLMLFTDQDCGGTADMIILYNNDKGQLVAVLGDLKTGRIRVEPSDEQLLFYLAALMKIYREKGVEIDVFRSFVYQPTHHTPYTPHEFTKSKVEAAVKKYQKAIIESKKEKPKLKVGSYCEYCKVKGKCPEYAKDMGKKMELVTTGDKLPKVTEVTDEVLFNVYTYSDQFADYIKACEKELFQRLKTKTFSMGLKLVEGKSNREWKDEKLLEATLKPLGISHTETKTEVLGIGKVTAALKEKGIKTKEIDEILYKITVKPRGNAKITTIDDPKEEYVFENNGADLLVGDNTSVGVVSRGEQPF